MYDKLITLRDCIYNQTNDLACEYVSSFMVHVFGFHLYEEVWIGHDWLDHQGHV